jgi:DNA-directed RNA polymerase I, II, and III subunit RPABC2
MESKANKLISDNDIYKKLNESKVSKPIMTKYEFNQIISQRATMLAHGAVPFVEFDNKEIKNNMELRKIAIKELKEGKLPFIVKRPLPNNKYDLYRVRDLDLVAIQYMF